jgi:hypothetical protein
MSKDLAAAWLGQLRRLDVGAADADDGVRVDGNWRLAPADHAPTRYQAKKLGDIAPVYLEFERVSAASG